MNREAWEKREKRNTEIRRLLRRRMRPANIAAKMGVSPSVVYVVGKEAGLLNGEERRQDRRTRIIKAFDEGKTEKEIAKKFNITESAVCYILKRHLPGYLPPLRRKNKFLGEKIIKKYESGKTVSELAEEFELSKDYVRDILKRARVFKPMATGRPRSAH